MTPTTICPRCNHEIPDAFYCVACGYVPPLTHEERNNYIRERIYAAIEGRPGKEQNARVLRLAT